MLVDLEELSQITPGSIIIRMYNGQVANIFYVIGPTEDEEGRFDLFNALYSDNIRPVFDCRFAAYEAGADKLAHWCSDYQILTY